MRQNWILIIILLSLFLIISVATWQRDIQPYATKNHLFSTGDTMKSSQINTQGNKRSIQKWVSIEGKQYPVTIEGNGAHSCLCIGIGTLMQRTLSEKFKSFCTVYSSDLYFAAKYPYTNPDNLNMTVMVNHVLQEIEQLKLKNVVLVAHSCFGILALEVAKQNNTNIAGVILVASAPQWNDSSLALTNEYFEKNAESERLAEDRKRKQYYAAIKKPTDSELSVEKYISDTARYWGNFHVSDDFIRELWDGLEVSDEVSNQFYGKILPKYILATGIEKITIPVILLAGERDFDSIPLVQWKDYPKPRNFTIINCGPIGHWPNLEASALFDKSVHDWLQELGAR